MSRHFTLTQCTSAHRRCLLCAFLSLIRFDLTQMTTSFGWLLHSLFGTIDD
jgi:hypothetical protein